MKPNLAGMIAASIASTAFAQIPAFPGAEGYGGYANGGRGGDVYVVTNLNNSGAGSFADAIATVPSAGRTIVFAVSGHIHMNGLRLTSSKVTIAGQTAPGDGVGLKDGTFRISGDDVVVRHLRFRHRDSGSGGDCINLDSGSIRSVLDHVSIQFSTDENISSFNSPPENVTMQWALNGWGLESHSCGGLWDQNHATAHHSLWSHNHTRNPKARPAGLLEWVNNVTFDWDIGFIMGESQTPASWKANVIGNYFVCPPGNLRSKALQRATVDRNGSPNFSVHMGNNRHDNDGDGILDGTDKGYTIVEGSEFVAGDPPGANRYVKSVAPFPNAGAIPVTTDDPTVALKKVVSKAGALRLDVSFAGPLRDEVDAKMVQNLVSQTAQHISTEASLGLTNGGIGTLNSAPAPTDADKDGMPDFYETALGWAVATQDHNTALANSGGLLTGTTFMPPGTVAGYTRLEEYLHFKSIPHGAVLKNTSAAPTSIAVNMAKYTSGFSSAPVFTFSNAAKGSVNIAGSVATFTPTLNFSGRARFDFTVTDSAGHSWTQTVGILVMSNAVPQSLVWAGDSVVNQWDGGVLTWRRNGVATAFNNGDNVLFDDTGSNTPNISFAQGAGPGHVLVDATKNYTTTGSGDFLIGPLTKRGSGTFTIGNTGTNNITPITLEAGTLAIPAGLLGASGTFAVSGGAFNFGTDALGFATIATSGASNWNPTSTRSVAGAWTGNGVVNFNVTGGNTLSLTGNTSAFAGTFALGASTGFLRLNGASGSAAATFDLGTSTADLVNRNGDATFDLGALSGGSGTSLSGATSVNAPSTYNIGATGNSTTFAGVIADGGAGGATNIVKLGPGTLTLTGASTHTGTTNVDEGSLAVNGSLASATTVASGAVLRGAGIFNGAVTTQTGAQVSPGAGSGQIGTLTAAGGLTATSTNFSMQLSSSPAGVNDKISITGVIGQVNGTNNFNAALPDGVLGAGNYKLIECAAGIPLNIGGGMVMNLAGVPAGSRQTFALNRTASGTAGGYIQPTVTGQPATLTWTGAASAVWDTTSVNWNNGAAADVFFLNDAVTFTEASGNAIISIPQDVHPRTVTVSQTTAQLLLNGPGGIAGGAQLVKNNSGHLLLAGAHSFTGGTILNGGVLRLISDDANASALDDGPVTLNGGEIEMSDDDGTYNDFTADLILPAGSTSTIFADARCDVRGSLTGAGTLNFFVPWVRTTLFADWSAFSGVINVNTDASGGDFRIGENYSPDGYAGATIALTANTYLYFSGISASGAGTTLEIGELNGPANAHLLGGVTGGRNFISRIGGKTALGGEVTFAGTIEEQNTGTTTTYVKTGAGAWRLTGSGEWNGATIVEQGTLRLWPSNFAAGFSCVGTTTVAAGATLDLGSGAFATEAINIAPGGALIVQDDFDITGDINNDGTATILAGHFTVSGDVVNNGTLRMQSLSTLGASGEFTNNGLLDLLTSSATLPANFTNNGTVILNTDRRILTAAKNGANFTVTVQGYAGHTFQLLRASALTGPWTNIGPAQNGAGSVLTFTDTGGATGLAKFYRVSVSP